jgi:hypothetical protein
VRGVMDFAERRCDARREVFSFVREHARKCFGDALVSLGLQPHVTMQPLATNDERSEMENTDRAAFARLRSFLVTARRGIGYVDFFTASLSGT